MYFIIYLTEEVLKGTVIAVIQGSSFDREVETEFSSLENLVVGNPDATRLHKHSIWNNAKRRLSHRVIVIFRLLAQ